MPPANPAPGAAPILPPALAADAILSPLFAYWHRQRGSKPYPDRADISPLDLGARLLPHVGIFEIVAGNLTESRLRLVGTALVDEVGYDPTGKRLGEYARGEYLELILSLIRDMLQHRGPVFSEGGFRWHEGRALMTRRLYLPLSQGGAAPTLMLFGQTFYPPRDPDEFRSMTRTLIVC